MLFRSNDNLCIDEENDRISYFVTIKNDQNTKGTPINSASDEGFSSFGVFGFHTLDDYTTTSGSTSSFIPNLEVSKQTSGKWDFTTTQYWPSTGKVSFFAYFPYVNGTNNYGIGISNLQTDVPALYYTTPQSVENQPDLMVAKSQLNQNRNIVDLEFVHALSCIGFSINGSDKAIEYIAVTGISTAGSLSLNYSQGQPSWSNLTDPTTDLYEIGLSSDYQTSTDGTIMAADGYLMLIPQTLTEKSQLVVKFENEEEKSVSLITPNNNSWLAGYKYTYELKEGEYIFDVSVDVDTIGYAGGNFTFTISSAYSSYVGASSDIGWTASIDYTEGSNWLSGDISDTQGGMDISKILTATVAPGSSSNPENEKLKSTAAVTNLNLSLNSNNTYSSANSYIVNAPGSYKFLCSVMVNALDNSNSEVDPNNWTSLPLNNLYQDYKGNTLVNISQLVLKIGRAHV